MFSATTPTTTTEKVMYLDGVPIKDFDQFVRTIVNENMFQIAAAVVDQLKVSMPVAQPTSSLVQKQIPETIYPQNSDIILTDPSRIREVSTLLRRAPQKFGRIVHISSKDKCEEKVGDVTGDLELVERLFTVGGSSVNPQDDIDHGAESNSCATETVEQVKAEIFKLEEQMTQMKRFIAGGFHDIGKRIDEFALALEQELFKDDQSEIDKNVEERKFLAKIIDFTRKVIFKYSNDSKVSEPSVWQTVKNVVNANVRTRRARIDMPGTLLSNAPTTFAQNSLDPEVNAVVTSLRTGNVMNVEQIRQLQNILQNYEQSLQTKELIAKRKQLQLLQNELIEQRKKIEEQRKLEEELRKKEQELEHERQAMELQLQEQLRMWHSSFSNPNEPKMPLMPVELSEPALPIVPHSIAPSSLPVAVATTTPDKRLPMFLPSAPSSARVDADIPSAKSLPDRPELTQEKRDNIVPPLTVNQFWPKVVEKAYRNHKVATTTDSGSSQSQSGEDSDEFTSSCQCERISLQKMKGKWSMALASKALIEKLRAKLKKMLPKEPRTELSCSRMTSPCREAALLVRNVDRFFDEDNSELVSFLKRKIANDEMDSMDIAPFANECSQN
ncbi:unnamed protein product [Haemonchus placei]|uniref:Uncharacterized protein n=1 Tax=Haemonchus placei TaxID=6290 RepID=A0A158QP62_HAEPC|nr:unnamed protein product [Haemonchus placei]